MKSYLLDTSAYSQVVRGHTGVANLIVEADRIYLSLITVAELEYGFKNGSKSFENSMLLMKFLSSKKVKLLIPDRTTAGLFAAIGVSAKKAGVKLAHHDLWLAAQTVQNNLVFVTFDKDFSRLKYPKFKAKLFES